MNRSQHRAINQLQRGIFLHNSGRLDEADAIYRQVLTEHPQQPDAHHLRALVFLARQDFLQALRFAESAIAIAPRTAAFFNTAGECHLRLNAPPQAAKHFKISTTLTPHDPVPHHKLALCLEEMGQWSSALESNLRALALSPNDSDALLHGLRLALLCGDKAHAHQVVRQLEQHHLNNPQIWLACGDIYNQQSYFPEAEKAFLSAATLGADRESAYMGIATFWIEQKRIEEARAHCIKWLSTHPESAAAHFRMASIDLYLQLFSSGWQHYEYRWQLPEHASPKFIAARDWKGEAALHLLLYAEQGLGDSLMFLRFIAGVLRTNVEAITLLLPDALERVAKSLPHDPRLKIVTALPERPNYDAACPLMSLPLALKHESLDSNRISAPYLFADEARTQYFRDKLAPLNTHTVGMIWAGGKAGIANQRRQMEVNALLPLLEVSGITLVSLQHGQPLPFPQYPTIDLTCDIADFHDLAAAMMALDVIVSIDSGPAHLAGALGKPCVTLLPWLHDWRWGIDGVDTYWYPSMRLIRQSVGGSWSPVIASLISHLRTMTDSQKQ